MTAKESSSDVRTAPLRIGQLRVLGRLLRWVLQVAPLELASVVSLRLLRSVIPLGILWIGKLIIDEAARGLTQPSHATASWHALVMLIACEFVLVVVLEASGRLSAYLEARLGDAFAHEVSITLMSHAGTLDLEQLEDPAIADRLERARSNTAVHLRVITTVLGIVQDALTAVILISSLSVFFVWLVPLVVIAAVPALWAEAQSASQAYSMLYTWTPERRRLDYLRYVAASSSAAPEVRLFGLLGFLLERYRRLASAFLIENYRVMRQRATRGVLFGLIGTVASYSAYAYVVYRALFPAAGTQQTLTIGTLTLLVGAFRQSREHLQRTLLSSVSVMEQALYVRDLYDFLDLQPRMPSDGTGVLPCVNWEEDIVFENVGFKYPGSPGWAVRHLNLRIGAGEHIALVGENGSGKTTIVKLLTRLYDPGEGRILVGGRDARSLPPAYLRSQMAVLLQEFQQYELPLRENIATGDIERGHDLAAIVRAAESSLADQVAARLPRGYEQQLGRHFASGVHLSGGEWQRVALARAFFRDARLYILDEPTASLDARAEAEVFERFGRLAVGRTAVFISHRFSTTRTADRIVVLRHGMIVELGAHEELVKQGGLYADLFAIQAEGYR